mgnify:CR=1 FL=1
MNFLRYIIVFVLILSFISCDNIFEYSVYEASVKSAQKNTTAKNLKLIEDIKTGSQDFKFAFVTDVHYSYDNLRKIVEDINKREDVLFVIFGGDITEQALLKEYEIFYKILTNLNKPYLTVIGNHDYNSNGKVIYESMFGDLNYSFEFNNNKFVLFDDIIWESNKDPDFDWLSTELSDNDKYNQVLTFAHIPTSSEDFSDEMKAQYKAIMADNNVDLSIHGHTHTYSYEKGEVSYLTLPDIKTPIYGIINIEIDNFNFDVIEL